MEQEMAASYLPLDHAESFGVHSQSSWRWWTGTSGAVLPFSSFNKSLCCWISHNTVE